MSERPDDTAASPDVPGRDDRTSDSTPGAGGPPAAGSAESAPPSGHQPPYAGAGPWWGHGAPGGPGHEQQGWGAPGGPGAPGDWGHGTWAPSGPWGQPGQWGGPGAGPWGQPGQWGGHGQWGAPPPRLERSRTAKAVIASALGAIALAAGVGIGYGAFNQSSTASAQRSPSITTGTGLTRGTTGTTSGSTGTSSVTATGKTSAASGAPSNMMAIAGKVDAGLVDINTVLGYQTEEAAGTGMVLTPTGEVLTNNHVIEGSTSISVTDIGNHRTYSATVLGYNRTRDVALIQLKGASGLQTVQIGNSSTVKVGQAVVGIGNAGGTGGSPSVAGGSVTALNQSITASDSGSLGTTTEHLTGLIESNCHIQPGDSGGPLVNTKGRVVGMDTAASAAQGFNFRGVATGQGYSIPVNTAMGIVHQITSGRQTSTVHVGGTAFLGVYVQSVSTSSRSSTPFTPFGTSTTTTPTPSVTQGAEVSGVISGTPAARTGLAQHDVITSVGGTQVRSASDLTKLMLRYHPGDSVTVQWVTPTGQTQHTAVTLASGPPD